jgi:hypothetical protein
MAEEKKGGEEKKKPAKKHLHEIRSEETEDGHIIHHQTYKKKRGDTQTEPERKNVAVSNSPEEAGQHVAEQFAMNDQPSEDPGQGGGDPGASGAGDAAPQEMMG